MPTSCGSDRRPAFDGLALGAVLKTGSTQVHQLLDRAVSRAGAVARSSWWCDPIFQTCQWREEHACTPFELQLTRAERREASGLGSRDLRRQYVEHVFEQRSAEARPFVAGGPTWQETHGVAEQSDSLFSRNRLFRIVTAREPCDYIASVFAFSAVDHEHAGLAGWCAGQMASPASGFDGFVAQTSAPRMHWLAYRVAMTLIGEQYERLNTSTALEDFAAIHTAAAGGADVEADFPIAAPPCPHLASTPWLDRLQAVLGQLFDEVCWVRTERMAADLQGCMDRYRAAQHGRSSFPFASLTGQLSRLSGHDRANANRNRSTCDGLYANAAARRSVWSRVDGWLGARLGYGGCCNGSVT